MGRDTMLNKLTIFFLIVGVLVAVLDINFTTAVQSNEDTQCDGDDCAAADVSKQQADIKPDHNAGINVSDEKNHITDDDDNESDEKTDGGEGVRKYGDTRVRRIKSYERSRVRRIEETTRVRRVRSYEGTTRVRRIEG